MIWPMNRLRLALAAPILGLAVTWAQPAAAEAPMPGLDGAAGYEPFGGEVAFGAFELAEIALPEFAPAADDTPFADLSGAALAPLPGESLAAIAGREDVNQTVNSRNAATVASNSVGNNSQTGVVSISDNAFQNLSGLSVININTGNNVAVNAAINVNISFSGVQ